mgnify:FL=1
MIGIIGAMEEEVKALADMMSGVETATVAGMVFKKGQFKGKDVVVVRSGIGKVNAAVCTQILADRYNVDCVINTGVAGSLKNEINIGDIVISSDAIQHDMDATGFGYKMGVIPRMPVSVFEADRKLIDAARAACSEAVPEIGVFEGRVVSGDQFITDKDTKKRLVETFAAYCTEMEGAAIAQAAYLNNVPFLVIRAISDKADGSAEMDYPTFEAQAAEHSFKLTLRILKDIQG